MEGVVPRPDVAPLLQEHFVALASDCDDPERAGDDVMLNSALAFDIRIFDPGASIVGIAGLTTEPIDSGWRYEPGNFPVVGVGAFVDLNYWQKYYNYINNILGVNESGLSNTPNNTHPDPTLFSSSPLAKSGLESIAANNFAATYDTWSFHYENDGLDQDGDGLIDEGTNGLDDDGVNGVDDSGERETSPPYDIPLRGVQVLLRIYEPDSRQIRQSTVTRNLVPN